MSNPFARTGLALASLLLALAVVLIACSSNVSSSEQAGDNQVAAEQHQAERQPPQQSPTEAAKRQWELPIPQVFNFAEYARRFNKHYGKLEAVNKAKIFFARTMQIFKHNVQFISNQTSHYLSQSGYIDLPSAEIRRQFIARDNDFRPVRGAEVAPEMPADDYYMQTRDGLNDGLSMGAPRAVKASEQRHSLDFFSDEQAGEEARVQPREMVLDLLQHQRMASQMAQVVGMGAEANKKHAEALNRGLNKIRKSKNIKLGGQLAGANERFDGSNIPSNGLLSMMADVHMQDDYADIVMNDISDHFEPAANPTAAPPVGPQVPKLTPSDYQPSSLGRLLNLVRDVYGALSGDEDDEDEEDEDEELDDEARQDGVLVGEGEKETLNKLHLEQIALLKRGPVMYDIDWRRSGCVARIKSQGQCNACYVFAALDVLEFYYCRQMKSSIEFSTQYVIDCGSKSNLNGCQGGKLSNVGIFIQRFGIQTQAVYPFVGQQQQCPFSEQDDTEARSFQFRPKLRKWNMSMDISAWYQWLPSTPLIVGINMPADFLAYGGGVHLGQDCTPGMVHAMVLVGSGKQEQTTFWLLKNTFAYSWGEGGYFRLSKRAPLKCFSSSIVAKVKF